MTARPVLLPLALLTASTLPAQEMADASPPADVLGTMSVEEAFASADGPWLAEGREAYTPNQEVVAELGEALTAVDSVTVFYGSWCGDSRREVPKVLATLAAAGYPTGQTRLVGVAGGDDPRAGYKQSPNGATLGHAIFRVPTVVLSASGEEVGRLLEKPKLSVERDLLAIAAERDYEPAYPVLGELARLDEVGALDDPNVLGYALAHALEPYAHASNALSSAGYVLLAQDRPEAAVKVLYANTRLFPDAANVYDSLAEALALTSGAEAALPYQRRAVALAPGDEQLVAKLERYAAEAANP